MKPLHPWKARLVVGIIMLVLAFSGVAITDVRSTGGWDYWRWIVLIYALLAIAFSWYLKQKLQTVMPVTLWHELLHWIGAIGSIFLVSYLVDLGTISRFVAGIFQLILLGLALFIAGIYVEPTFMVIGLVLGLFALVTAVLSQYFYFIIILIIILAAVAIAVMIWLSHRKFKKMQNK